MQPSLFAGLTLAVAAVALGCGDNSTSPSQPVPAGPEAGQVATATALAFYQLSASDGHTCAVTTGNRAYCWGTNYGGMLGDGTRDDRHVPTAVKGGLSFRQISAGVNHTCGVTTDFRAYCWGDNSWGQLGGGNVVDLGPTAVAGGKLFRTVEAGFVLSCGLSYPDNRVYCWGTNGSGELGDGTTTGHAMPKAVLGGLQFRQITVGYEHACGITTDNWAYCWGNSQYGQVGDSSAAWKRLKPTRVAGGRQFRHIDAGAYSTCAVAAADDRAYCWGRNNTGQIGDGTLRSRRWPVPVAGGLSFRRVSAGGGQSYGNTCGETLGSRAYCWGDNSSGVLGDGTTIRRLAPAAVVGGLSFSQLSAGDLYACGKTAAGVGYCWGVNGSGELGDGTTTLRSIPTPVAGGM